MAKWCNDEILDAALAVIKTTATRMVACSSQPASFAGVAGVTLASVEVSEEDFTISDGDASGRKVRVASKSNVTASASGNANHVALVDDVNSKLLYVTTAATLATTSGNPINFPAWNIEIADPA